MLVEELIFDLKATSKSVFREQFIMGMILFKTHTILEHLF